MNNNIQCSIESSTTKIELNSAVEGVFLVPELEGLAGLPEIRTTSGVNAGYDGGWTSAQNYDARLISIRGVIANPDISKVEDKRRAIASLLGQGRKEQLTLRFTTEAGNAYAISVRTISCEMALQRVLTTQEFLIQLRADDPLIYDDGATGGIAAILQPQRALGGFEINFDLPLTIGGGAEDTVVDNGNETVYPVIKLYGALHSPTVVNRTTNQQMQILADLQYSIDWHTYRSATGDYILVNDGLDGAPMTLSQLTGNIEQTTYSGKNLINTNNFTTRTSGGITTTWSNNVGTASGTTEATSFIATDIVSASLPAGTYTFSVQTAIAYRMVIALYNSSTSSWVNDYTMSANQRTITFTTNFTASSWRIGVGSIPVGTAISNLKIDRPMLESGSTATEYEPYVGGIPAPNPQFPMPISTVTGEQTVQVAGKNLFNFQEFTDYIADNGITRGVATYTSSSVTLTATSNDCYTKYGFAANIPPIIKVQKNTDMTLSWETDTVGTYEGLVYVFGMNASGGSSVIGNQQDKAGKLQFNTGDYDTITLRLGVSTSGNSITYSNIMLEYGSQPSEYKPYDGAQSYDVNLGKNLLPPTEDWSQTINGVSINYEDGIFTFSGTATANTVTTLRTATAQYTIRDGDYVHYNNSFASAQINIQFYFTDGTSFATSMNTTNRVFSIDIYNGTSYVGKTIESYRLNFNSGNAFNGTVKPMIVHNVSTPTSFAPYKTPIELAEIGDYQDYIWNDDGTWKLHKATAVAVLNGTENWAESGTTHERFVIGSAQPTFSLLAIGAPSHKSKCDYFKFQEGGTAWTGIGRCGFDGLGTFWCMISGMSSLADFKTWLGANNVRVYYPLATPTDTEITDETLRAQLNFLASLYSGVNNISLVGTGAQGEMVVRYATDYTVNQDIITIDSQARTITLNGQDVYHLKTSESEFLVLAPGENKLYLTSEVSDDSGYAEVKFKQGYLSI